MRSSRPDRVRARAGASADRAVRLAVVGTSTSQTCGVRAHADLLARALEGRGVACSTHWLMRDRAALRSGRAELGDWARALPGELRAQRADAVLLHYSIFAHSHRGIPVHVPPLVSALRRAGLPLVSFMHELAYPWRLGGWRGHTWALAQRVVLVDVLRLSRAVVLTTDFRAEWLASRRWLPRRPTRVAPVFSNLPPPQARPRPAREHSLVGVFGYSYDERAIALALDAIASLERRGRAVELTLLGAPGGSSQLAEAWRRAAAARGVGRLLSFRGPLPAQELSDALAACDALLFADPPGPSSRKGTLAGALASGRPLIATDGPRTWPQLAQADAIALVAPESGELAGAIAALLDDPGRAETLGARGRAFAEREMGVERSAEVVREVVDEVLSG